MPSKKPQKAGITSTGLAKPKKILSATSTAVADSCFIIMLYHLLRVHPAHFPITSQDAKRERLHAVSQHNGYFVLVPRSGWSAELLDNKDLIDARTGAIDGGGIYKLTRREVKPQ
jgi:hypothetical protein